ncbi:MAG: hypothetical protein QXE50_05995 [Nitrososphaerota archaeon]
MSWEDADEYEVTNVWVDVAADGSKTVVIEVQGRRADGSYWVNGFNIRIPKSQYDLMTEKDLNRLIISKIAENELEIEKWRNLQAQSDSETTYLKTADDKAKNLIGKKYHKPKEKLS